MNAHSFALAIVVGSALLAFWFAARFSGPTALRVAALQMLVGFAAVRAIPGLTNAVTQVTPGAAPLLVPFAVALPLLTYGFLSGLWVLRSIHRSVTGLHG